MAVTAVICATLPCSDTPGAMRAQLYFAGQTVMEYQVRQAHEAGAVQAIALVDAVTPSLSRMVDRLMADGIKLRLIRDMPTLMRDIPRDGGLLLFADGAIAEQKHIDAIVQSPTNALLVAEDNGAMSHLERIDGIHRWCGVAKIAPETLFETLDLIGDWDLSLTLVRAAVQANAKRVSVPQNDVLEGRVAVIDRQATADLVAQALLAHDPEDASGQVGAEHYVFAPLARLVSHRLVRMQVPTSRLWMGSIGASALALLALYPDWVLITWLLLAMALLANLVAEHLNVMARRGEAASKLGLAAMAAFLVGIVGLGSQYGQWESALYLAVLSGIIQVYVTQQKAPSGPKWAYVTPGSALLMAGFAMVSGLVSGVLVASTLLAIASVGRLILVQSGER